ncbi:hypothetical protein AtNW77_Chr5g0093421 [Arabidopsis thaliana]|uniref:Gb/AAD24366.1 n=3 Tax=Arabidopsis TaxID=3701 RepID=Q9FIB3_ARATH|nr:hypothetical protein (DUF1635) [Arabidopsis thaliana]AED91469.1 hypothetical protein (DUF1635) [Arabidopsis thaliana]KAG7601759.1 hypothetical protein ISN45_At05g008910 [Arabidopsis thaliana x Arabidopsis arenosa]OAO95312.1 hypothetical protein AXX17_AT5G09530 [Arabidopsis thaliana]BAB09415.1 unnamed protein product [Arabidopsis thaliana]|eukprot:NP_196556.1 hypothetical protein (DUF1635) [Arabidopsis thaliana]
MYQETKQFYHLWLLAVQERDEAREHLKQSLVELSRLQECFNTILLSEDQQIPHYSYSETTDETPDHQKLYSYNNFSNESPSRFSSASSIDLVSNSTVYSSPETYDSDCYSLRTLQMGFAFEEKKDFETLVLENIGLGRMLPENGKFQQAIIEAGSLVDSLFITGPIPKWRNPPVQMLSQRPLLSHSIGKWNYGGQGIINRSFSGKMPRLSLMP